MNYDISHAYSAFVYEVEDVFMADCSKLNLVSAGITPDEAIENLKESIQRIFRDNSVQINPVFERR